MKLHFRIAALGAVSVLLFAACGGGNSSSGRTRNAALNCYADQTAKDDAVAEAQAAFDNAASGSADRDGYISADAAVVAAGSDRASKQATLDAATAEQIAKESAFNTVNANYQAAGQRVAAAMVASNADLENQALKSALADELLTLTSMTSEREAALAALGSASDAVNAAQSALDAANTAFSDAESAAGAAFDAANGGDAPELTEEQQLLQTAMQDAEAMSLCGSTDSVSSSDTSSPSGSEPSENASGICTATLNAATVDIACSVSITVAVTLEDGKHFTTNVSTNTFGPFNVLEHGSSNQYTVKATLGDTVLLDTVTHTVGDNDGAVVEFSVPGAVTPDVPGESGETSDTTIASDTTVASGPFEPGCPGDVPTIETDVESPTTQNIVQVSTSNPSGECDSSIDWAVIPKSGWDAALRGEPFTSAPPCSSMMETECELEAGDYVIFAAFSVNMPFQSDEPFYEGWQNNVATMNFTVTGGGESGTCQGVQLEIVDPQWVRVDNCSDSLHSFSLVGLGPIPLNMVEDNQINIEDGLPEGWIDMTYLAEFTDGSTERGSFTQCWTSCNIQLLELAFSPENPKIGDAIWFSSDFAECFSEESIWRANLDTTLSSSSAFHQPFRPSQSRRYHVLATGICADGSEVYAEAYIEPQAIAAPAHDNINDAQRIEGAKGSASGTTLGATREIDEPVHTDCAWEGEATSWLIWTAPQTGALTTSMTGTSFGYAGAATYTRQTMQRVPFTFDDDWNAHLNVVEGTEYAIAIMSCYDSNFGDFVFNWEMDTREDASPSAFGIPSVGNGNTPAQEAPVDVTTITTADNGVSTLVVDANTNQLVFSDTDLDALRALAGVTTGDVFVELDSGQVIQLSKLGKTKIRLGDTKNLKVIVPGAKVQDVVIQLKRTENGGATSSSTSGGMSPISMLLIAFLVLALIGGGALQLRRKQGVN